MPDVVISEVKFNLIILVFPFQYKVIQLKSIITFNVTPLMTTYDIKNTRICKFSNLSLSTVHEMEAKSNSFIFSANPEIQMKGGGVSQELQLPSRKPPSA